MGLFTFACDSAKPDAAADAKAAEAKAAVAAPVTEVQAGADAAPKAAGTAAGAAADADAPKAAAGRTAGSPKTVAVKDGGGDKPSAVGEDARVKAADPKPAGDAAPADDAAPPAAGGGETVAQKDGWANYQKELKRKIDQTNASCGSKLSGSYDKSTYTDFDPIKDRTQSACQQAVDAMKAVCMTDAGKESVQKLSRVSCKFSTSGTGVAVSGNTLVIKIDPVKSSITGKAAGSYSWASALKENL